LSCIVGNRISELNAVQIIRSDAGNHLT
jgi:hypothetical protein